MLLTKNFKKSSDFLSRRQTPSFLGTGRGKSLDSFVPLKLFLTNKVYGWKDFRLKYLLKFMNTSFKEILIVLG